MLSYDHNVPAVGAPNPASFRASASSGPETKQKMSSVQPQSQQQDDRHIWIITGPAGCGKTTVARYLAEQLHLPYVEGDEHHPPANIAKMSRGEPLTDADRWDWLIALRQTSVSSLAGGAPGVVLTCSALKEKYRDVIRMASYNNNHVRVHFVYLRADEEVLLQRVAARQGHYMKDSMVRSQFRDLEEPRSWEVARDCLIVDVAGSMPEVQELALRSVKQALSKVVVETMD